MDIIEQTAPLDIDNHKMENLPEPLEDGDAVNKKYVDGVVEDLTLKQGLIRENGGFNLVDSYINMNFNNIRNVGNPNHESDAVPRSFVENMFNKRPYLIAVHARYCGKLKFGDYPFDFGGNSIENCAKLLNLSSTYDKELLTGFVMPHSGRIKKIICDGLTYLDKDKLIDSLTENQIKNLKQRFGKEDFTDDLFEKIRSTINLGKQRGSTFISINKIKKKFTEEKYAKLISQTLISQFEWKEKEKERLVKSESQIEIWIKFLNINKSVDLEEGDIINIEVSFNPNFYYFGRSRLTNPPDEEFFNVLVEIMTYIFGNINFNFTFLIELDPL